MVLSKTIILKIMIKMDLTFQKLEVVH